MTSIKLRYDPPVFHQSKKAEWYVDAYIYHPNGEDRYRHRRANGLNVQGTSKTERIRRGNALRDKIHEQLKAGLINPWPELEAPGEVISDILILPALEEAYQKKLSGLKPRSKTDYASAYRAFVLAIHELNLQHTPARSFTRRMVIKTLDHIKSEGKSNHRYNMIKQYVSSVFSVMVEMESIEQNPFYRVGRLKVGEPKLFTPATDEQQGKIDEHLYKNHKPLFLFKALIELTGVRPVELMGLRANDLDYTKETATIQSENSKVGATKEIPLTEEIALLLKQHLANHIGNPYVFSKGLQPGATKKGRNTASTEWKEAVIDAKTGLGINVKLYSNKHYGTDKKILAGIPLDYLRQVYGHKSSRMTERYASNLLQQAHNEVRQKAPSILANIKKAE